MNNQQENSPGCPAAFVRRLLAVAAEASDTAATAQSILDMACVEGLAQGAAFWMLDQSQPLVSAHGALTASQADATMDLMQPLTESATVMLPPALRPHEQALLLPLHVEQEPVAVLAFLFDSDHGPDGLPGDCVQAVSDALQVVAVLAHSNNRRRLLSQNQNHFVRLVSHDLRSLLTSISGFANLLDMEIDAVSNPKQARYIHKVLSGVGQVADLVDNIQDAGRLDPDTGFYELHRTPVDLIALVAGGVGKVLLPAEKQNMQVVIEPAAEPPILSLDKTMLERALANLVMNAVNYTADHGLIQVKVEATDEQVVISVKDNGIGIDPQYHDALFRRHFRVQRSGKPRVKGSGLGLFIVQSVARHHGGLAWMESVEDEGSTFFMSIPLTGDNLLSEADDF
mgnify:CR=1 FL=1